MRLSNNNIETLPIDMIVVLLKLLVIESFQDFYNFFIAWARTKRNSVIVLLLDSFPLRDLYKFRKSSRPADVTCFDQFFRISEQLRINDGIFYARCRDIVCGVGNIESHFTILDHLASSGQLLYMAGKFFFTIVYKNQSTSVDMLRDLLAIRGHPYYRMGITNSLTQIRSIKSCGLVFETGPIFDFEALCPLHFMVVDMTGTNGCGMIGECFICNLAGMLNVFTDNVT